MQKTGLNSFFDNFHKVALKVAKIKSCQDKILIAKGFKKSPKWLQIAKSGSTVPNYVITAICST